MSALKRVALALLIIGGLNWGLIGLFQYDLVAGIFGGQDSLMSRVIYTLVGLSAIYCVTLLFDTQEDTSQATRELNYSTEFSEENDLYNNDDDNKSNKG